MAKAEFQGRCLKPLGHPSNTLQWRVFAHAGPAQTAFDAAWLRPVRVTMGVYCVAHHVVNASGSVNLPAGVVFAGWDGFEI